MKKYCVLFNPYSGNYHGEEYARKLDTIMEGASLTYKPMPDIENFKEFLDDTKEEIIICGGDGTINYFINKTRDINYKNTVLYFETGTGNDFHNDIGNKVEIPYEINRYLKDLPIVKVKGKEYLFLNNVGFGIDGYCCEVGDIQKKKSQKPVNYTSIAIKGLLFHFKPRNAEIEIDGKKMKFKKVWLAPTMNGRYYGGGMMAAPNQDRLNKDHSVSLVVMGGSGKIKTLVAFPSIFTGDHIKKDMVKVFTGHHIKVKFDKPCALQIDGETILDVSEYEVNTK